MVRRRQQGFVSRLRRARRRWAIAGALGAVLALAGVAQALSFSSHDYPIPPPAFGVVSGHFNGDRKLDLIAVGDKTRMYYLQGKAGGHFADPVPIRIPGKGFGGVAGDFNRDGNLDIVVADDTNNALVLMRSNGDGTFKPPQSFPVGNAPQSPEAADFNRDGRLDVAVANQGDSTVSVLLGKKSGGFKSADTYHVNGPAFAVATGKINSDRRPDIVSEDDTANSISVLLAKADGTFQPKKVTTLAGNPEDAVVRDFNGDGINDVATANWNNGTGGSVSILRGLGNGRFKAPRTFPANNGPWQIAAGFINRDRKLDVAVGNEPVTGLTGGVSVYLGHGDGTLGPQKKLDTANAYSGIAIANFDGKGGDDIASAHDEGGVKVFLNQG